jgi:D-alanyl-D-alanine carboxypeptidase
MTGSRRSGRRRAGAERRFGSLVALAVVAAAVTGMVLLRGGDPTATPSAAAPAARTPTAPSTGPAASSSPPAPPPGTPTAAFDRTRLSIDDPASSWVVVNKARPLVPLDYAPADLVPVGNGRELRAEAAQAMDAMLAAAAVQGLTLSVQSAYRSYDYQMATFARQVARFGEARAEIQVARPGFSEHQTGLAADIGGGCDIETCFATTAEGRWVAAHAAEFGYLVRYPDGMQEVTGYKYEPWHVRYVGVVLATELERTGVSTLEEFFGLPAAPGYAG